MFNAAKILAFIPAVSGLENGFWCVKSSSSLESIPEEVKGAVSFRGEFRDFSLYVEPNQDLLRDCTVFGSHFLGDDGLWVVEEPNAAALEKTKASLLSAGQKILYEDGFSLIATGGTDLPGITGLDGCGADLDTSIIPVPSHTVTPPILPEQRLKSWAKRGVSADPLVQHAVDMVSISSLNSTIATLQDYNSRNSYSETIYDAQDFLVESIKELGFTISYMSYNPLIAPNVIATWAAFEGAAEWVVAGAHMDSRSEDNKSGTARAPGADDNGTGSAGILELARIVNATGYTFNRGLRLCFFTGEEQGLLGSRALASKWAKDGEEIHSMVNADMLGYQSTPEMEQAFMNRNVSPELTAYTMDLINTYVPGMKTTITAACCSDYSSFYENGYPSVGFFESSNAATAYPSYHKTTDLLVNINQEQLKKQIQGITATVFSLLLE